MYDKKLPPLYKIWIAGVETESNNRPCTKNMTDLYLAQVHICLVIHPCFLSFYMKLALPVNTVHWQGPTSSV